MQFRRTDTDVVIPATLTNLARLDHATTLSAHGASIETVEHLLSALYAMGVDDVLVEVDGPEVPILDGSALPFVMLIREAGLRPHSVSRTFLKVLEPVEVVRGGKVARVVPADHFEVHYTIGFDHPLLRSQSVSVRVTPDTYAESIAPARTFGFLREVEELRRRGLALGGSLDNAIVIGETGVLNKKLRFEDEFVRHKVLDVIGDVALLGRPVIGRVEAVKGGHALHAALAHKLIATPESWTLLTHPSAPIPVARPAAGRLAALVTTPA